MLFQKPKPLSQGCQEGQHDSHEETFHEAGLPTPSEPEREEVVYVLTSERLEVRDGTAVAEVEEEDPELPGREEEVDVHVDMVESTVLRPP